MTATLPLPARTLAAIGLAVLAALLLLLVVRPMLSGGGSSSASPTAPATHVKTSTAPQTPAQPKVTLLPGVPNTLAAKLQSKPVVVVTIYSGTSASDRALVGVGRAGAKTTGAAFASYNVLDESSARDVSSFFGTVDVPAVAVVRRPGTVVTLIPGPIDEAIVEQAAHNAGARR